MHPLAVSSFSLKRRSIEIDCKCCSFAAKIIILIIEGNFKWPRPLTCWAVRHYVWIVTVIVAFAIAMVVTSAAMMIAAAMVVAASNMMAVTIVVIIFVWQALVVEAMVYDIKVLCFRDALALNKRVVDETSCTCYLAVSWWDARTVLEFPSPSRRKIFAWRFVLFYHTSATITEVMVQDGIEVFLPDTATDCKGVLNPAIITAKPDVWASRLLVKDASAHVVVKCELWEAYLFLLLASSIRARVVVFEEL